MVVPEGVGMCWEVNPGKRVWSRSVDMVAVAM
jgi:hypothetical protein